MGKGTRNRRIRKAVAAEHPSGNQSTFARALRRHGRLPLVKRKGQS